MTLGLIDQWRKEFVQLVFTKPTGDYTEFLKSKIEAHKKELEKERELIRKRFLGDYDNYEIGYIEGQIKMCEEMLK